LKCLNFSYQPQYEKSKIKNGYQSAISVSICEVWLNFNAVV